MGKQREKAQSEHSAFAKTANDRNAARALLKNREWVREHYIDKQLTAEEIAHIAQCSTSLVVRKLADYDIPRRTSAPREMRPKDMTNGVLMAMLEQLGTAKKIAEYYGVSYNTALKWFHEDGVYLRELEQLKDEAKRDRLDRMHGRRWRQSRGPGKESALKKAGKKK